MIQVNRCKRERNERRSQNRAKEQNITNNGCKSNWNNHFWSGEEPGSNKLAYAWIDWKESDYVDTLRHQRREDY